MELPEVPTQRCATPQKPGYRSAVRDGTHPLWLASSRVYSALFSRSFFGRWATIASGTLAIVFALGLLLSPRGATLGALSPNPPATLVILLVGGPLGLGATARRAWSDRRDGLDRLALSLGVSPNRIWIARTLGAVRFGFVRALLPMVSLSIAMLATSPSMPVFTSRLMTLLGAVTFAIVTAVVMAGLAAFFDALSSRGRSLWLAFVLGSSLVASAASAGDWSAVGAMRAAFAWSFLREGA